MRFIVDIHKKQMALTKFTLANIVYERECLKFIGVGFRDGGYVNWKEDMKCLHDLVKEIFQNRSFPRELDVWCALIPHLNYNKYVFISTYIHIYVTISFVLFFFFFIYNISSFEAIMQESFFYIT